MTRLQRLVVRLLGAALDAVCRLLDRLDPVVLPPTEAISDLLSRAITDGDALDRIRTVVDREASTAARIIEVEDIVRTVRP